MPMNNYLLDEQDARARGFKFVDDPTTPAERLAAAKTQARAKAPKAPRPPRGVIYDCALPRLRARLGLSQRDVCRAVGITPAGYHQVEHGHEVILTTALKLSEFFGVDIKQIWKPKGSP